MSRRFRGGPCVPVTHAARPESARSLRALIGNVTEPPGGLFRLPGAFSRHEFSADYTTSMIGFDFRQGQE